MTEPLEGMIGLEIHAYLVTKQKLFCTCKSSRERGLKPNTFICPICCGMPGSKPMLPNKEAVKKAVQIGLMLGCTINTLLIWQRKHYDWPDLPKGYQNTLSGPYAFPVGISGKFNGITVSSMHLEEDPASWTPTTGEIDYNRSGLPLVEIVTAPEFTCATEVIAWLKKLLHNLEYLKAVDSNAGIKVDVNVNIPGKSERVEIKNINSLESIEKAINYEFKRQAQEGGKKIETRRYDEVKGKTMLMRTKEGQADYRFISDPDLQELVLDASFISQVAKTVPESPEQKLKKIIDHYNIGPQDAQVLTKHIDIAEFFEKVAEKIDPPFALPWVTVELFRLLNEHKVALSALDIQVAHFVKLLELVRDGKITELQGKQLLKQFYPKSFMPEQIAGKITDVEELGRVCKDVLSKNPQAVSDYKSGGQNALNFLLGEIMRATQKRADFKIAREVLQKILA